MVKKYFNGKRYYTVWDKVQLIAIWLFKWFVMIAVMGGIITLIVLYVQARYPKVIYTTAEVIKEVPAKAPILDRIAKCESPSGHYDKTGQVVARGNKNSSVDIGKYQINNDVWGAQATKLGYNLFVEKDNEAMAHWIYENVGTGPWYLSAKCWSK